MVRLYKIHHIAIICSDYEASKHFYINILGFTPLRETFRHDRWSFKLDLLLNGVYQIELFSFPGPAMRATRPEATGLRHLAFAVDNIDVAVLQLMNHGIASEPIRTDDLTNKKFTFFRDPDDLPLELYEIWEDRN